MLMMAFSKQPVKVSNCLKIKVTERGNVASKKVLPDGRYEQRQRKRVCRGDKGKVQEG